MVKVIVPGHEYEVSSADGKKVAGVISFIQKKPNNKGVLELIKNGTSTEEVIKVLIDRVEFLDTKVSGKHNKKIVKLLKEALTELEARTADRVKRGVVGTNQK